MRIVKDEAEVKVPATSANLGPGYDCMGLALSLHDRVRFRATSFERAKTWWSAGSLGQWRSKQDIQVTVINKDYTLSDFYSMQDSHFR